MFSLEKSERFQKEYTDFSSRAEKVENMRVRGELDTLLKQLLAQVRIIDMEHKNVMSKTGIADTVSDSRTKLATIRKKITKYLEDYENSLN
jgi:hypothetical protein